MSSGSARFPRVFSEKETRGITAGSPRREPKEQRARTNHRQPCGSTNRWARAGEWEWDSGSSLGLRFGLPGFLAFLLLQ